MRHPAHRRRRPGWHRRRPNAWGVKADYIPHHEPFEYYASTANPHHLAPASLQAVGRDTQTYTNGKPNFDTANHQYDTSTFDKLVSGIAAGQLSPNLLPAVSFLKAAGYQDGHAAYSDPIDEQQFIVNEINALEKTPDWSSTAVVISYDDSDGWYDHAFSGITNPSQSVADALTGTGACGNAGKPLAGEMGRCGFGPRLPLLVISPWARANFVDHTRTNQASIIRFIEGNWRLGHITGRSTPIAQPQPHVQLRSQAREEQDPAARPRHGSAPGVGRRPREHCLTR